MAHRVNTLAPRSTSCDARGVKDAEPQVLVAITQMVLRTGVALGLDRQALLGAAGIDEDEVVDRDAYISLGRQVALGEAIVAQRPGRNIGLEALAFARPSTFGALGYVVGHCTDLKAALEAFMRYQNLLSRAVRWTLEGSQVRIEAAPPMQRLAFPLETQIGMWVSIGRQLTGVEWVPQRVRLRHHPRGPEQEFTALFGRPVEFGAAVNALELDAETFALPIRGARPELKPSLVRLVQALTPAPSEVECYTDQVRALLLEELPRGLTSKDEAARKLGVSERTLARRLGEENSSFRELLTLARKELACAWLRDRELSLHEVAYLLGYSEPSTFHRSFRRWTGETPAAWRRAAG